MHSSWLKKLFEKKNNEEWLAHLLEKKEIDSEQHTFLKDLLAKRDAEEKSGSETNSWWKNVFEHKYDGHKPFWGKEGAHNTDMNWKWSHGHSHAHSHSWETSHSSSWSKKTTTKTVNGKPVSTETVHTVNGKPVDDESSDSSDDVHALPVLDQELKALPISKGGLKPLVANLRGGKKDDSSDSESSDGDMYV